MKRFFVLLFVLSLLILISFVAISNAETFYDLYYSISDYDCIVITGCFDDLQELNVPSSIDGKPVVAIEEGAFYYARHTLETVTIPASVVYIHEDAFEDCDALQRIIVAEDSSFFESPDGVLVDKLKSMLLVYPKGKTNSYYQTPDNVLIIGKYAFQENSYLTEVDIADGTELIFYGAFLQCESLQSVTIPDSVRVIEELAFYRCYSLEEIILPDSLSTICSNTFSDCTQLKKVTIPNGVEVIKEEVFSGCWNLVECTILGDFIIIYEKAFYNCLSLTEIKLPSYTSIATDAFNNCPNLTLYVSRGSHAEEEVKEINIKYDYSD